MNRSPRALASDLFHHLWTDRKAACLVGIPAACYAVQNNLVFIAISNLSAAAAQVLYQLKTLSTAFFTVVLLGRSFQPVQWASFALLCVGVVLVQSQDAKSATAPTGSSPLLGVFAALGAATLSGFAGVFLERMFTTGNTSLWMRNVQLCLFTIPLQLLAVFHVDGDAIAHHGLLQGFHASTWLVVATQVAGSLLTAVVIKFAGNVLKTFATVLALLATCFLSTLLFDFHPTPLFAAGVAVTATSIWLYARPADVQAPLTRLWRICCAGSCGAATGTATGENQNSTRLAMARDVERAPKRGSVNGELRSGHVNGSK